MSRALSFAVFCIAFFAALCFAKASSERHLRSQFGSFVNTYQRDYATAEEYEIRFQIFKANVESAALLTAQSKTATFGITKFSDWTPEERKNYLGKIPKDRSRNAAAPVPSLQSTPTSYDYSSTNLVPLVRDQGSCGSCWAFSTAFGASAAALSTGIAKKPSKVDLSPQQIVDCCTPRSRCAGCNGGDIDVGTDYLINFGGAILEKDYPYKARDGTCVANKTDIALKVDGYEWVIPPCTSSSSCKSVDSQGFLAKIQERKQVPAICVYATNAWFDYTGGIYDFKCSPNYSDLNHCVGGQLAYLSKDDAADGVGYVTIQNNWSDTWGEGGRMRLKYDPADPDFNNPCGVFSEAAFTKVSKP